MEQPTIPMSAAEREIARLKKSCAELAAKTKRNMEKQASFRTTAARPTTAHPVAAGPIAARPSPEAPNRTNQRRVVEHPFCDNCGNPHNPKTCFMTDKAALEKFFVGKSNELKQYWYQKVEWFEQKAIWHAKQHEAYLERCARREKKAAKEEAYLKWKAEREEELARPENKRMAHQRTIRKMIKENGDGAVFAR